MAVSQRVVAGVTIDERLSMGPYGAIHKAHTASRRDLRALVIDARLSGETAFAHALLDEKIRGTLTSFDHPAIVPTLSIAKQGDELVVVTVGPGRHTTVADVIAARRKLPVEVAGAIAQAVVQGLAAAHARGLVHGAVHPRSVAIDDAGQVKVNDFAVGRALAAAIAQGADRALARELAGAVPPEIMLGEPATAAGDVYAAGALLFTMLVGEAPPGPLRVTPAVERVVQRSLDTDPQRRFRDGAELLESLLEAFDDDRWSIAGGGELRKLTAAAGGSAASGGNGRPASDGNLDDDTEDLLASLGNVARGVQLTRASMDLRAAAMAERQKTGAGKPGLDALLADLDREEHTAVDDGPPGRRDPISEIIRMEDQRRPLTPSTRSTVGPGTSDAARAFEDEPEHTPLPPPDIGDDSSGVTVLPPPGMARSRPAAATTPAKTRAASPVASQLARPGTERRGDEIAALSAIADLDARPGSEPPGGRGRKARRGSSALDRLDSEELPPEPAPAPPPRKPAPVVQRQRAVSAIEPALDDMASVPRLKSRFWPVVWVVILLGGAATAVYVYLEQQKQNEALERDKEQAKKDREAAENKAREEQDDPGNVVITSEPPEGSAYMLLGRTPMDYPPNSGSITFGLPTTQLHELRIELDKHTPVDVQVPGNLWSLDQGEDKLRVAKLTIPLAVAELDRKGKPKVVLPQQPAKPPDAVARGPFPPGRGVIHVETTPAGAAVWLFLGTTNNVRFDNLVAGRDYEFRVLKDGYLPGYIKIAAEDWRKGGDPRQPLSAAPKHDTLTKAVTLVPDPQAPKPK